MSDYDDWVADKRLGRNSPSAPPSDEEYEGDVIDEIEAVVKKVEDAYLSEERKT